jgi:hypothetical protein
MIQFARAVIAAELYAVMAFPLFRIKGGFGRFLAICVALITPLCAFMISQNLVVARAFAELVAVDLSFKMIDFCRQQNERPEQLISFPDYLRFLLPFPVLLIVFGDRDKHASERPPLSRELAIVLLLCCVIAATVTAVFFADESTALQTSFPLDQAIKLALFVVTIEAFSRMSWGLERLAGYGTTPIIDHCYLATTPADFWRRYNRRVGQWLYLNVFRPSGGRKSPIRGVFLTFFVSAVFHEVCFAIATSRFTGCQFAFFFLQAPAVAVSNRIQAAVDRAGPSVRAISRGITVAWFYATSVLFFEGVDRIFPFVYANRPSWLP